MPDLPAQLYHYHCWPRKISQYHSQEVEQMLYLHKLPYHYVGSSFVERISKIWMTLLSGVTCAASDASRVFDMSEACVINVSLWR